LRVLVLGGSQFLGRHIVETFLTAGHAVTTLSRGQSRDELPQAVERLRADRDDAQAVRAALGSGEWDACIDVSGYTPRQVRPCAEHLRDVVKRYVYISAVSVYGDPARGPVTESEPTVAPAAEDVFEIDGNTYGPLKVACENIVREVYGERALILRPQVIVGPHDQTSRLAYWLDRAARNEDMLAPGDGTDYVQFIDVRDVARFVRRIVETNASGTFNLSGPRLEWGAFLGLLGARRPVWVAASIIKEAKLTFVELPLYRPNGGARSSLMHVSNERAVAAGLQLTAVSATLADTARSIVNPDLTETLSHERAAALIALGRNRARQD
jgi:2'-hydroxyisoflavone reductase